MFLSSGDGYVWELLSCLKGVKDPFAAREGRWDFSRDATVEKGLISRRGENLLVFLELWQETWGSSQVTTGTPGTHSCCLRKVKSPSTLRGASLDSSAVMAGVEVLTGVGARNSGFLSSANMDLRVPLEFPQGSQASSLVETCKSALLSSLKSSVRLPVELT